MKVNEEVKQLNEITIDELLKKYHINEDVDVKVLKEGIKFLDDAWNVTNQDSKNKLFMSLMEYAFYKMNGGSSNE